MYDSKKEFKKKALELWLEMGSLAKVSKKLFDDGYQTRNNTAYSVSILSIQAKDFIIRYPNEARKIYQAKDAFPDTPSGDREWLWFIVNEAAKHKSFRGKPEFIRWAVQNGIYKKAFDFFRNTYNLSDEDYHVYDNILDDYD